MHRCSGCTISAEHCKEHDYCRAGRSQTCPCIMHACECPISTLQYLRIWIVHRPSVHSGGAKVDYCSVRSDDLCALLLYCRATEETTVWIQLLSGQQ